MARPTATSTCSPYRSRMTTTASSIACPSRPSLFQARLRLDLLHLRLASASEWRPALLLNSVFVDAGRWRNLSLSRSFATWRCIHAQASRFGGMPGSNTSSVYCCCMAADFSDCATPMHSRVRRRRNGKVKAAAWNPIFQHRRQGGRRPNAMHSSGSILRATRIAN